MDNKEDEVARRRKDTLCCLSNTNSNPDCAAKKWIILRFLFLFFISLIILCCVYGLRGNGGHAHKKASLDSLYAVGDPVYARDLWMVVELASDSRGLRTQEGKAAALHVCAAIKAAQAVGWTPLVVGGRSPCCRSRCRHLHPADLSRMNHTSSSYFLRNDDVRTAMKTAAFLAAIKKGAHFIYQANPEVYYRAGVSPEDYQSELQHQLRKTTLGISVGLVKETRQQQEKISVFDPYTHFVAHFPENVDNEHNINRYKICEIRPPSIEKFLDSDGQPLDASAPGVTVPGAVSSPFDSRNAAFAREAFWALILLPLDNENEDEQYIMRSVMAQAIMGYIGGSTKFSVSNVATPRKEIEPTQSLKTLMSFVQSWTCPETTALRCLQSLGGLMASQSMMKIKNLEALDMWVADLLAVGYDDIPVALDDYTETNEPCIGQDALYGVYFHPAKVHLPAQREARILVENSSKHSDLSFGARMVQRLCPSLDLDLVSRKNYDRHENILLIITFYRKEYHNIPLLEIMYRHHFANILYCGAPDEVVDDYMAAYNGASGTYFSFLPVHRSAGYECLLGAIEMGYNVNGFLLVNQDTLVNSWNFDRLNPQTVWHGNEHAQNVTVDNLEAISSNSSANVMRSTLGILNAFQFLEDVLLRSNFPTPRAELRRPDEPKARAKRSDDKDKFSEFSDEEMEMAHHDEDDGDEEEDMSIADDEKSGHMMNTNEWHINLFGEIVHDNEMTQQHEPNNITTSHQVTELLFHPANFANDDEDNDELEMATDHFHDMMFNIQRIYKRINKKLHLWVRYKELKMSGDTQDHDMEGMKKELEHLQCDLATNAEICHLVASFFSVLDANEGNDIQLVYDDLPIYYVPEAHKDKLYLMANLFTKYHVADELAFPLLLRGLSETHTWETLTRAQMVTDAKPILSRPQDLLLLDDALDEHHNNLDLLEAAHYHYPVDVKSVLTNDALRNVVCRNF